MYTNARSIVSKIQDLEILISENNPDIILVTETWCNESINTSVLNLKDYEVLQRNDRCDTTNGIGGGLLVYAKKNLVILPCDNQIDFNQYLSFKIKTTNDFLNIYLVYRPPSSSLYNYEKLCDLMKNVPKNSIVIGDFNFPNINWEEMTCSSQCEEFLNVCIDNNLTQYVNFETHVKHNILDLVFGNDDCIVKVNDLGPLGNSDHTTLEIVTNHETQEVDQNMKTYNWKKANINSIKNQLQNVPWNEILVGENVEDDWNAFKNKVKGICDKNIPIRLKNGGSGPIWLTREITRLRRKKVRAYKKMKRTRDPADIQNYLDLEKQTKKAIKRAKKRIEVGISKSSGNEGKRKFNNYVKSKLSVKSGIGPLVNNNNEVVADSKGMADLLNNYFSSVYSTESRYVPNVENQCQNSLNNIVFTQQEVKEKIKKLKFGKAPGPDGICTNILKNFSEELILPLCILFQLSLDTGQVPEDWKVAKVVPIFKKGLRGVPANYRPVSLTSVSGKLMESVIRDRISDHLIINRIINLTQHGFMPNRSCQTNLLEFLDKVFALIDEGKPVDIVYLDFSKAFDKVPFQRLLKKIDAAGVRGNVKKWISEWLTKRMQWVEIDGQRSSKIEVKSGVPQGSVLGPLLFIIFINDIDDKIVLDILRKFADDTKGAKAVTSEEDRIALQKALDDLFEWGEKWGMSYNIQKCKILHCGRNNPKHIYRMNEQNIMSVTEEKDIGVCITENLKPSTQCIQAANRARAVLAQISKCFHYRDRHVFIRLYKQYVRPHLEFSSSVWSPWYITDINKIEEVQMKAVKMVSGLNSNNYEGRLKELGLWSLEKRRKMMDLVQCYKIVHGIGDISCGLKHIQENAVQGRAYTRNFADPINLQKPRCNLEIRKNFFSSRIPDWWNELPSEIKHSHNTKMFKKRLVEWMSQTETN